MTDDLPEFGSVWTERKLQAVDGYLEAYLKIMQKQSWAKLVYIDAFSGGGKMRLKDGKTIEGSAIRSLRHRFDRYIFNDIDSKRIEILRERVASDFFYRYDRVLFCNQDANELLATIESTWESSSSKWRGVIFIDPYAMQLDWASLEHIAKTEILDVWYFFPLMALNRMLVRDGSISDVWQKKLTEFLGTDDWMGQIYPETNQATLFGEIDREKLGIDGLKAYVLSRLKTVFPTVSDKAVILHAENGTPLFILCFMGSNPSERAKRASLRVADHLLLELERLESGAKQ